MISDSDIAAMEARARAATEGPWRSNWRIDDREDRLDDIATVSSVSSAVPDSQRMVVGILWYDGLHSACRENDAEFIAHARTDVPALIAEVRRLQREVAAGRRAQATIKALQQTIDWMNSGGAGSTATVYALPRPSTLILPAGASIEDACKLLGEDPSNWKSEGLTGQAVTYTRIDAEKSAVSS